MAVNLKSLYTKETSKKLDKVESYGKSEEKIPGHKPSQKVLEDLELKKKGWPRYEPAYEVIKAAFPNFDWKPVMTENGKHFVIFYEHPNPQYSLAEMILESYRRQMQLEEGVELFKQRVEINAFPQNIQQRVKPLLFDENGKNLAKVLVEEIGISYPPMSIMEKVREWYYRALDGEETTIIVPVCPDYETRATGDPSRPRVYTFEGLGDSVGYVAQRALHAIPKLWELLKDKGVNARFVVAIGDFEADSEETRNRVGLSKEAFLEKLRSSQETFKNACPIPNECLETPFITEIGLFYEYLERAKEEVKKGNYGAMGITEEDMEVIAKARRSLYHRWYGENVDIVEVLKSQAPEYMAMGPLADEYPNALILGADSVTMAPFMQGLSEELRPVIYMRNINY